MLERILVDRLSRFFQAHQILYKSQFGFRTGSSTLTAAHELVDDIYEAFDNRSIVGVLFLDLKKAFDTINHEVLLRKLDYYGVRGTCNALIRSYLSNRSQYVLVNSTKSSLSPTTVGVPQGSNLGPLLFLIYIIDLPNLRLHGKPRLFADDTSLSYRVLTTSEAIHHMEQDMKMLKAFFDENLLSLNLNKTKYMIFHSRWMKTSPHVDLIVNSTKIDKVECFKYLGLTFDSNLNWNVL